MQYSSRLHFRRYVFMAGTTRRGGERPRGGKVKGYTGWNRLRMARVKQIRRETQGISLIEGRSEFIRVIGRKNKGANVPFRLRFTTPPEDLHNVFERPFSPSAPVYLPAPRKKRRDVIFEPERGDTKNLRVRLRCVPNRVASPRSMKSAIMRRLGNEVHFDGSRTARRTEGLRILKVQGNLSWQFNWDRSACR